MMLCVSCTVGKHVCSGPVSHIPCDCVTCPTLDLKRSVAERTKDAPPDLAGGLEEFRDTLW